MALKENQETSSELTVSVVDRAGEMQWAAQAAITRHLFSNRSPR
jgi:hypothetical protein